MTKMKPWTPCVARSGRETRSLISKTTRCLTLPCARQSSRVDGREHAVAPNPNCTLEGIRKLCTCAYTEKCAGCLPKIYTHA